MKGRKGEHTLDSINAHRFNHVMGKSERYFLRNLKCLALSHQFLVNQQGWKGADLVEKTIQINMDSISS